jgi:8-oxo-dGTP pyrophosphatase MutT (NUDIX family)
VSRALDRAIAIAVLRRGDEILVSEVPDAVKGMTGWRPPGGGIEFGERGAETVVREIEEELGVRVGDPRYLGTVENIFTYLGVEGHQLVRVYQVRFADSELYKRATSIASKRMGAGSPVSGRGSPSSASARRSIPTDCWS